MEDEADTFVENRFRKRWTISLEATRRPLLLVEDTSLIQYSVSQFSRNYSPTNLIAFVDSLKKYSTKAAENLLGTSVY